MNKIIGVFVSKCFDIGSLNRVYERFMKKQEVQVIWSIDIAIDMHRFNTDMNITTLCASIRTAPAYSFNHSRVTSSVIPKIAQQSIHPLSSHNLMAQ